jgi:urease accessory protein
MLIQEKIGNTNTTNIDDKIIDWLFIDWFEANKRILHKKTNSGNEVILKFLQKNPELTQGDILQLTDTHAIVVDIKECDAIVISPRNMFEVANICYEIGNKHLPLFYQNEELLVVWDKPLFSLLEKANYLVSTEKRKLLNPLKTSVAAHTHTVSNESFFSKIIKLTTPTTE